jgi:hypothetical protein
VPNQNATKTNNAMYNGAWVLGYSALTPARQRRKLERCLEGAWGGGWLRASNVFVFTKAAHPCIGNFVHAHSTCYDLVSD